MRTSSEIDNLLGRVFDSANEGLREELTPTEYEQQRHDFVFHMTDWREDLDELANLFDKAGQYDEEAATTFIIGFLYHVVPHIKAAARLLNCEMTRDPFAPQTDGGSGANMIITETLMDPPRVASADDKLQEQRPAAR